MSRMMFAVAMNATVFIVVYVVLVLFGTEPLGGLFWGCVVVALGQLIYLVPCLKMMQIPERRLMAFGILRIAICTFVCVLAIAYWLFNIAIDTRYR